MKTVEETALLLKKLHESTFAGKPQGRYKLSRDEFKRLAERDKLKDDFVFGVMAEAEVEHSLKVIAVANGQYFGVIAVPKILGWRSVPARLIP